MLAQIYLSPQLKTPGSIKICSEWLRVESDVRDRGYLCFPLHPSETVSSCVCMTSVLTSSRNVHHVYRELSNRYTETII